MAFLYMLECAGGAYYTGIAKDIERRLREHVDGSVKGAKYTRSHPPLKVVALWEVGDYRLAAKGEYALKQLSRECKEALIEEPEQLTEHCPNLAGLGFSPCFPLPELKKKEKEKERADR